MNLRPAPVVFALLLAAGSAACGSGGSTAASGAKAASTIEIKNFAFSPTPLVAKVGDTITVLNTDSATHTLTADDDSLDTGNVAGGAKAVVKLTKAGTLAYHCHIHDYMKGVIQVS